MFSIIFLDACALAQLRYLWGNKHDWNAQAAQELEASLAEERAQCESRLSKMRAELSAVRSEAAARMRDLEGQVPVTDSCCHIECVTCRRASLD